MKEIEKVIGKFKYLVEDFIVEEIGDKWDCKVSKIFNSDKTPDFGNLDFNSPKDFLWCEMEKKDIDHFQAIKDLASKIGKWNDSIGYSGSKDKRAITSQRVSIFQPNLELLKKFNHPNIFLKNFKWAKRKIKIGYLKGNHFRIIIRDLDKKDAIKISNKIRGLEWFPNYFGPQRFGSLRKNNVKIGKLILKRKFEEAVWTILTDVGINESSDIKFAREKLLKEKDFDSAAGYFPNYLKLEKGTLNYLSRNPGDFIGAIKKAERKNMLMFVHSVQSKIFNEVLEIALDEGIDFTKKGLESCILAGYKTRFYDGRLGEIEREVLENHGLQLNDFDVSEIPYLRIKGSFRKAVVKVDDLEISVEDDEVFSGSRKVVLSFTLPSGVYATTFLEKFFDFE